MGRIKILLSALFLIVSVHVFATTDTTTLNLELIKTIAGHFSNLYVDNLENFYVQTSLDQLIKLNSNGDSIAAFNNVKRYGNISFVDVTNPLKILIYYKDFTTVITTDRFLTNINTIDLRKANIYQVKTIASSYDNNIWMYDELDGMLKKVDDKGNVLFQSTDFRLLFSDLPHIEKIIDNNAQLYLYDSNTGWYIFDYYGTLKTKLPFTQWKDVSVKDKILQGRDSNFLYAYDPSQLILNTYKTNLPESIKIIQQNNKVYILMKEGIFVYGKNLRP